ncbi:hypothetical protein ACE1TI_11860 [Alteribacillus sp. JSM 102045]|uniref:hypothetical protein n=1 Tax=Alteribacillus sp. JSM 102045 TaxID=1562101 RepID=UPI0035BF49C7
MQLEWLSWGLEQALLSKSCKSINDKLIDPDDFLYPWRFLFSSYAAWRIIFLNLLKTDGESTEEDEEHEGDLAYLKANDAVKIRFWLLWGMMFIDISAGIMLLSVASPMSQEITGARAATIVGVMGLFNGAGRIAWASDYIGRPNTISFSSFFKWLLSFYCLTNVILFSTLLVLIISYYGGGFACLPAGRLPG